MIEQFQHYSKYARFDETRGRREHWPETVDRVINFFEAHRGALPPELRATMLTEGAMPSMRTVQMAGAPAERCNVSIYSCAFSPIEDVKDFADALYIMMQGTGFAFSVERKFVNKLPTVAEAVTLPLVRPIIVEDTTESWCDALASALRAAYDGLDIAVDVSAVRPAGARLATKGGYASGPAPLVELLELAHGIVRGAAGRQLRPFEVHRIMCKIGQIVQVGGVRRAAMLSLSDIDDLEMREAKNGAFWERYPELTMANNSAAYRNDAAWSHFNDEWANLIAGGSGERGIFNARAPMPARRRVSAKDLGTNPCVTGDAWVETTEGRIQVRDLVDRPFVAVLPDGGKYPSAGFWKVGDKQTIRIVTQKSTWDGGLTGKRYENSYEVELTPNHQVMTPDAWVAAGDLKPGDRVLTGHGTYVKVSKIRDVGVQAVYDCTVSEAHRFVANDIVVANCGEINLVPRQFCNLSIAIVRPGDTLDDLRTKVRVAAIFGTLQASFTDFRYIKPDWSANCRREALLGVDLQGALDNPLLQDPANLRSLRALVLEVNQEWASRLNISRSAAATCIKPSGNSGERFGTGNSLTGWYAPFFERRVVVQKTEPMYAFLRDQGVPCEEHYTDERLAIFVFPKRAPEGAVIRGSRTAIEQLEWWLTLKKHWTEHNPSATIYVRTHEWNAVNEWVTANRDWIGGLSFLGFDDAVYKQAPFTAITESEYEAAVARFPNIDWSYLDSYEHGVDNTTAGQEFACLGDSCTI